MGAGDNASSKIGPMNSFAMSTTTGHTHWRLPLNKQRKVWEYLRTDLESTKVLKHFKERAVVKSRSDTWKILDELAWTLTMCLEDKFHFLLDHSDKDDSEKEVKQEIKIEYIEIKDPRIEIFKNRINELEDEKMANERELDNVRTRLHASMKLAEQTKNEMLEEREAHEETARRRAEDEEKWLEKMEAMQQEWADREDELQSEIRRLTILLDEEQQKKEIMQEEAEKSDPGAAEREQELQAEKGRLQEEIDRLKAELERRASATVIESDFDSQSLEKEIRDRFDKEKADMQSKWDEQRKALEREIVDLKKSIEETMHAYNIKVETLEEEVIELKKRPNQQAAAPVVVQKVDNYAEIESLKKEVELLEMVRTEHETTIVNLGGEIARLQSLISRMMEAINKKGVKFEMTAEEQKVASQARGKCVYIRLYEDAKARLRRAYIRWENSMIERKEYYDKCSVAETGMRVKRFSYPVEGEDFDPKLRLVWLTETPWDEEKMHNTVGYVPRFGKLAPHLPRPQPPELEEMPSIHRQTTPPPLPKKNTMWQYTDSRHQHLHNAGMKQRPKSAAMMRRCASEKRIDKLRPQSAQAMGITLSQERDGREHVEWVGHSSAQRVFHRSCLRMYDM